MTAAKASTRIATLDDGEPPYVCSFVTLLNNPCAMSGEGIRVSRQYVDGCLGVDKTGRRSHDDMENWN